MSDDSWYYAKGNQQHGPLKWEALVNLKELGEVTSIDLVWTPGMPSWQPAGAVPGLGDPLELPAAGDVGVAVPNPAAAPAALAYYTPPEAQLEFAGFWLRFAAFIIDYLAVSIVTSFLFVVPMRLLMSKSFQPNNASASPGLFAGLIFAIDGSALLIFWLYFAIMESSRIQGTLGKMACGIRVVDLNGQRIGFARATGRTFGKIVSGFIFCVGFMMAGWTRKKQALHDMMANTLVVKKR